MKPSSVAPVEREGGVGVVLDVFSDHNDEDDVDDEGHGTEDRGEEAHSREQGGKARSRSHPSAQAKRDQE